MSDEAQTTPKQGETTETPKQRKRQVKPTTPKQPVKRKPPTPQPQQDTVRFTATITPETRHRLRIVAAVLDVEVGEALRVLLDTYDEAQTKGRKP